MVNKYTIAGLVIAFLTLVWAIYSYYFPHKAPPQTAMPKYSASIKGSENLVIQGKNNTVIPYVRDESSQNPNDPIESLNEITTGWPKEYLEHKFGPAIIKNIYSNYEVTELIHSSPKFYLQSIFDKNDKLIFYSVTSKSMDFHPQVPRIGIILGKSTFSEIGDGEHLYSYLGSKYYTYAEVHYFGNPGNYRNYYFAYNPAGVDYASKWFPAVLDVDGKKEIDKMRQRAKPNTFGVGDILGDELHMLKNIGIGIEYYVARDIK